jgi:hypothetical protein
MQAMKPISILLAAVTLVGSLAATLLAWFVETFPFESTRPDDQSPAAAAVAISLRRRRSPLYQ